MIEMNELPDEVLEFILSQLPPYKDLRQCQLVCKRWSQTAKCVMRLAKMNLNKGLLDFRLCWKSNMPQETTPTIAGRFSHSAVLHENSMYIFGGGSSTDTTFNDLWRFDLSTRKWIRPLSMGSYPSPKASSSMVCYGNNLVLFGGLRYPSLCPPYQPWRLFDEVHFYNIEENRWTVQTPVCGPPPMAGHSATIHQNKMIVFGGYKINEEITSSSNDVWCLNLETCKWTKPEISAAKPQPRYGQFQLSMDSDNLLIFGGCGGPNNMFNDAWVLNMVGEKWHWKNILIKNKKWAATHMWCYPACRVGTKLVVLGPTPNLPSDLQILKQMPQPANRIRGEIPREENRPWNMNPNLIDDEPRNQRAPAAPPQQPTIQRIAEQNESPRHNPQPSNRQQQPAPAISGPSPKINEDDAASRLQRNLALRSREDDVNLPKRFDEPVVDRIRMAAFNVQDNNQNSLREKQQERVRRMEEKMNALRNSRRNIEQKPGEPSPKRAKRNCLAIFICDITNVLAANDPHAEWIEYKNYGIVPGAPERLILSTIVPGNGELIMFGGVQKESLSEMNPQVSNSVHFLTTPKTII